MAEDSMPAPVLASESSAEPSTLVSQRAPVTVTTSSSLEYIEACARSNQVASRNDPLTLLFQAEKLPSLPNEPTISDADRTSQSGCDILRARLTELSNDDIERMIYESGISRMTAKCKSGGAFIAEAGKFAAVTCWEPQYAPSPPADWTSKYGPEHPDIDLLGTVNELMSNGVPMSKIIREKPIFGEFWMKMEGAKYKYLYPLIWRAAERKSKATPSACDINGSVSPESEKGHLKYWYICLTSRNPAIQPPVPGAVRAVIEPIMKRFIEQEDISAVWILAANKRARDVYGYFGFRVVHEILVGKDEFGGDLSTWCMIYTKDRSTGE